MHTTPLHTTPGYSTPEYYAPGEEGTPLETNPSTEPSLESGSTYDPFLPLPSAADANTNKVRISMNVPTDASVYLNDQKMTSVGSVRKFVSPKLSGSGPYVYHIRVELTRDGENLTVRRDQKVLTGENYELTFAEQGGAIVYVAPEGSTKMASR